MLLTGTFVRNIDEKLRFSIPKPVRSALGYPQQIAFYFAPGTDSSLALYPEDAFIKLAEQLAQAPPTGHDVRAFSRMFYARAQRIEADRQARIRIPAELAKMAQIGSEIVVVGIRDHLEIWDQSLWDNYLGAMLPRYDEFAESAFGAGESKQAENSEAETTGFPLRPK